MVNFRRALTLRTQFYREFVNPPRTDQLALLSRLSDDEIWQATRVNQSTINRWRNSKTRMDYATEQLLRFIAFGYIPHGFKDWAGFYFGKDGKLYPRDSPFGYSAGEIRGLFMIMQAAREVPGLCEHIKKLETELKFHKQQTVENSQLGFMRGLVQTLQELKR
jgi:hypothetical protein